jgi:hypothetical protein
MKVIEPLQFLAGPSPSVDGQLVASDGFCTEKVRADDHRVARIMEIYPIGSPKHRWSFRSVFVFLNEPPDDWAEQRPSRRSPKIPHPTVGDWVLKAFYADHQGDGGRRVTMKVDNDWNPWMSISRPDPEWDDWILMRTTQRTTMGTEGRPMNRLHDREL